jgi:hypothetical protein
VYEKQLDQAEFEKRVIGSLYQENSEIVRALTIPYLNPHWLLRVRCLADQTIAQFQPVGNKLVSHTSATGRILPERIQGGRARLRIFHSARRRKPITGLFLQLLNSPLLETWKALQVLPVSFCHHTVGVGNEVGGSKRERVFRPGVNT